MRDTLVYREFLNAVRTMCVQAQGTRAPTDQISSEEAAKRRRNRFGVDIGRISVGKRNTFAQYAVVQPHIISLGFFIIFKCNELKAVFSGAIIFNFRIYFLVSFFFAFKLRSTSFSWAGISSQ